MEGKTAQIRGKRPMVDLRRSVDSFVEITLNDLKNDNKFLAITKLKKAAGKRCENKRKDEEQGMRPLLEWVILNERRGQVESKDDLLAVLLLQEFFDVIHRDVKRRDALDKNGNDGDWERLETNQLDEQWL